MTVVDYRRYQTWPEEGDESPFRYVLGVSDYAVSDNDRLRGFRDSDRFVVRIVPAAQLASSSTLLSGTARLRAELAARGLSMPPHGYVIGSRHIDGRPQAFVIAERVSGAELVTAVETEQRASLAASRTCAMLLDFYRERFERGGTFPGDIKADQFMWGRVGRGPTCAYMVDLDVGFGVFDPAAGNLRILTSLHWAMSHVINMVAEVERRGGRRLRRARAAATRALAVAFPGPVAHRSDLLREVLRSGEPLDGAVFFDELE